MDPFDRNPHNSSILDIAGNSGDRAFKQSPILHVPREGVEHCLRERRRSFAMKPRSGLNVTLRGKQPIRTRSSTTQHSGLYGPHPGCVLTYCPHKALWSAGRRPSSQERLQRLHVTNRNAHEVFDYLPWVRARSYHPVGLSNVSHKFTSLGSIFSPIDILLLIENLLVCSKRVFMEASILGSCPGNLGLNKLRNGWSTFFDLFRYPLRCRQVWIGDIASNTGWIASYGGGLRERCCRTGMCSEAKVCPFP